MKECWGNYMLLESTQQEARDSTPRAEWDDIRCYYERTEVERELTRLRAEITEAKAVKLPKRTIAEPQVWDISISLLGLPATHPTASLQMIMKEWWEGTVEVLLDEAKAHHTQLTALQSRCAELEGALRASMNNIGVPQPGYPANIAHAYDILKEALNAKL